MATTDRAKDFTSWDVVRALGALGLAMFLAMVFLRIGAYATSAIFFVIAGISVPLVWLTLFHWQGQRHGYPAWFKRFRERR